MARPLRIEYAGPLLKNSFPVGKQRPGW